MFFSLPMVWGQKFITPFYYEFIQLPLEKNKYQLIFSYRVPHKTILFEKKDENYYASFSIAVEIAEENSPEFKREFINKSIQVINYDETISGDIFVEGLIKMDFEEGNYNCFLTFSDENASREIKLPAQKIVLDNSSNNNFIQPFVVHSRKEQCGDMLFNRIANYGSSIPFDPLEYSIVIPVIDDDTDRITVKLYNNGNLIFDEVIDNYVTGKVEVFECDNRIYFRVSDDSLKYKLFNLERISSILKEGSVRMLIQKTAQPEERFSHTINVVWINKPNSLLLNGVPVKVLEYIDEEESISHLKRVRRSGIDSLLHQYWKKYDPTPLTEFNELKQEFYNRVDYAIEKFASINGKNGAESDRGKIYITLGKPEKIERTPSPDKGMYEIWYYEKLKRTFTFFDDRGTGNYILTGEQ